MPKNLSSNAAETSLQRFERVVALEPFKGLKAILDNLRVAPEALCKGVLATSSYEDFLKNVGYRLTLTKQLHVQDCYSRMGPAGGIRTVLPYHDIPSQSSLPTVMGFDSTVTTTAKSASFFNDLLAQLKKQLGA